MKPGLAPVKVIKTLGSIGKSKKLRDISLKNVVPEDYASEQSIENVQKGVSGLQNLIKHSVNTSTSK